MATRDASIVDHAGILAGVGVATSDLDRARREWDDARGRSAAREHHDDAGNVLAVVAAVAVADAAEGKGR